MPVAFKALLLISLSCLTCHTAIAQEDSPPNFLFLIGDDMGVETLSCYGVGTKTAHTPNIDRLCDQGVRFDNFWAQPVCSPTRAAALTGQFGFRNGVGTPVNGPTNIEWSVPPDTSGRAAAAGMGMGGGMAGGAMGGMAAEVQSGQTTPGGDRPALQPNAWTMLQALKLDETTNYATAAVGKWHLANDANGALDHPKRVGFDHYAGSMRGGGVTSYYAWSKVIDGGDPFGQTGYASTDIVDDGIAWLAQRGDEPWFLWVAFNAPHSPLQVPPRELLTSDASLALDPSGQGADSLTVFNAMIEAMDTEIGRLLENIGDEELANTYVMFMGDNGTGGGVTSDPYPGGHTKGSMYQGGVNVPFIVTGPELAAGTSNNELSNVVDIFATVLELAGSDATSTRPDGVVQDTVSMVPILSGNGSLRDFNYADHFGATRNGEADERTLRTERYKLIQDFEGGAEEMYDLANDPYEDNNLLQGELNSEEQKNYDDLVARINALAGAR